MLLGELGARSYGTGVIVLIGLGGTGEAIVASKGASIGYWLDWLGWLDILGRSCLVIRVVALG